MTLSCIYLCYLEIHFLSFHWELVWFLHNSFFSLSPGYAQIFRIAQLWELVICCHCPLGTWLYVRLEVECTLLYSYHLFSLLDVFTRIGGHQIGLLELWQALFLSISFFDQEESTNYERVDIISRAGHKTLSNSMWGLAPWPILRGNKS